MIYTELNRTGEIETVKAHGGVDVVEAYGSIGNQNPIFYSKKTLKGTSPLTFKALGQPLKEWKIYGETVQVGVPSPDNPADVQGCGDRTENLFDYKTMADGIKDYYIDENGVLTHYVGWNVSDYIPCNGNTFTIGKITGTSPAICLYDENKEFIVGKKYDSHGMQISITITSSRVAKYIRFCWHSTTAVVSEIMLNNGDTALPYEPYGYKIQISSAPTTTPVYLGEVDSTRHIKKLVLTGNEPWQNTYGTHLFMFQYANAPFIGGEPALCTEYIYNPVQSGLDIAMKHGEFALQKVTIEASGRTVYVYNVGLKNENYSTVEDFKAYLAQQYTIGNPVTIWYPLETPETAVANEPLHHIGNRADTISFEQAGLTISTVCGSNAIYIVSTVKPSAISITDGIKPTGYGQLLDVNDVDIQDSTGEPIYIQG